MRQFFRTIAASALGAIMLVAGFLVAPLPSLAASPSAILSIQPSSGTLNVGDTLNVDIKLNTGGQAVSGVAVWVTVPAGLTYVSANTTTSDFPLEVTPPTSSTGSVHLARVTTSPSGVTSSSSEVAELTFTATASGTQALGIDINQSEADATSDSSNILVSVSGGSYTVNAVSSPTPTPTPTPTSTPTTTPTATPTATATPTSLPTVKSSATPTATPKVVTSTSPTPTPSATPSTLPVTGGSSPAIAILGSIGLIALASYLYLSLTSR